MKQNNQQMCFLSVDEEQFYSPIRMFGGGRRRALHSLDFKIAVITMIEGGRSISEVAKETDLGQGLISQWWIQRRVLLEESERGLRKTQMATALESDKKYAYLKSEKKKAKQKALKEKEEVKNETPGESSHWPSVWDDLGVNIPGTSKSCLPSCSTKHAPDTSKGDNPPSAAAASSQQFDQSSGSETTCKHPPETDKCESSTSTIVCSPSPRKRRGSSTSSSSSNKTSKLQTPNTTASCSDGAESNVKLDVVPNNNRNKKQGGQSSKRRRRTNSEEGDCRPVGGGAKRKKQKTDAVDRTAEESRTSPGEEYLDEETGSWTCQVFVNGQEDCDGIGRGGKKKKKSKTRKKRVSVDDGDSTNMLSEFLPPSAESSSNDSSLPATPLADQETEKDVSTEESHDPLNLKSTSDATQNMSTNAGEAKTTESSNSNSDEARLSQPCTQDYSLPNTTLFTITNLSSTGMNEDEISHVTDESQQAITENSQTITQEESSVATVCNIEPPALKKEKSTRPEEADTEGESMLQNMLEVVDTTQTSTSVTQSLPTNLHLLPDQNVNTSSSSAINTVFPTNSLLNTPSINTPRPEREFEHVNFVGANTMASTLNISSNFTAASNTTIVPDADYGSFTISSIISDTASSSLAAPDAAMAAPDAAMAAPDAAMAAPDVAMSAPDIAMSVISDQAAAAVTARQGSDDSYEEPVSPPHFSLAAYKLEPDAAYDEPVTAANGQGRNVTAFDNSSNVLDDANSSISAKLRNLPGIKVIRRVEQSNSQDENCTRNVQNISRTGTEEVVVDEEVVTIDDDEELAEEDDITMVYQTGGEAAEQVVNTESYAGGQLELQNDYAQIAEQSYSSYTQQSYSNSTHPSYSSHNETDLRMYSVDEAMSLIENNQQSFSQYTADQSVAAASSYPAETFVYEPVNVAQQQQQQGSTKKRHVYSWTVGQGSSVETASQQSSPKGRGNLMNQSMSPDLKRLQGEDSPQSLAFHRGQYSYQQPSPTQPRPQTQPVQTSGAVHPQVQGIVQLETSRNTPRNSPPSGSSSPRGRQPRARVRGQPAIMRGRVRPVSLGQPGTQPGSSRATGRIVRPQVVRPTRSRVSVVAPRGQRVVFRGQRVATRGQHLVRMRGGARGVGGPASRGQPSIRRSVRRRGRVPPGGGQVPSFPVLGGGETGTDSRHSFRPNRNAGSSFSSSRGQHQQYPNNNQQQQISYASSQQQQHSGYATEEGSGYSAYPQQQHQYVQPNQQHVVQQQGSVMSDQMEILSSLGII